MLKTILVGLFLTMFVWQPVLADNLLVNGSCEVLDWGTDHPTGWRGGHSKHTSWITVPDGKNYCYTVSSDNGTLPHDGMWQDIAVKQGFHYELTFWSGTHNVWNQVVELHYLTSADTLIESVSHSITHIVATDNHLGGQYQLTLPTAPVEATFIRVWIYADNDWAKVDALDLRAWSDTPSSEGDSPEPTPSKLFLPILAN